MPNSLCKTTCGSRNDCCHHWTRDTSETGARWAVIPHSLKPLGVDENEGEEAHCESEPANRSRTDEGQFEEFQVEDGMFSNATTHDKRGEERKCENDHKECSLGQPAPLVALDDHQCQQAHSEHGKNRTEVVDGAWRRFIAGLLQQFDANRDCENAQRNVDQENCMPAESVDEKSTNCRTTCGGHCSDCTPNSNCR